MRYLSPSLAYVLPLAALALIADTTQAADAPKRPLNVLLIAVDDLRPELGCYPHGRAQTPNLDQLAAEGVRFDRAYCQFPLCNPSRTSLLTGRYPQSTGVVDSFHWFQALHPEFVSLPRFFQQHGYHTLRAGKIFHGGLDDAEAWTTGGEPRSFAGDQRPPKVKVPGQSDRIAAVEGDGSELKDYQTATAAERLLETHRDEPFFLAVGFIATHSPLIAPRADFERYDAAAIKLPSDFSPRPTLPPNFPAAALPVRNGDLFVDRTASPQAARETIQAYLAATSFIDTQVGRVLRKLNELGLADNTIVIFFGDHGYHLGERGKWSKHNSLFEVAARVPLIVRLPGAGGNGSVCPRTVQLLDIYPTLAAATQLTPPQDLEGHSLLPLLTNPQAPWPHPAFTMVSEEGRPTGLSIRTERRRYTEWNDGEEGATLFDHDHDPAEHVNLAENPEYSEVVVDMKRRLGSQFSQE